MVFTVSPVCDNPTPICIYLGISRDTFNQFGERNCRKRNRPDGVRLIAKIDLVMWTLNGESTLAKCLASIEKAVPTEAICHRCLVDTELFSSFEQDIGLNPAWFGSVMTALLSDPHVAVAQGLRAASGSRYLEAIDNYGVRHGLVPRWIYSIDNNLYRTEALRSVGGFPLDCAMSADGAMRNNLFRDGWKWRVCRDVVSLHYRDSFVKHLRHVVIQSAENKVLWETYPEYRIPDKLGRVVATPLTSARMASEAQTPGVFFAYPLFRAVRILSRMIGSISKQYRFMEVRSQ